MSSGDVVELYRAFCDTGIEIWVDGGWAVDALLGRQTRPHKDLDIVVRRSDEPKLRELLGARGYRDVPRDDTSAWNFVLGDASGREVDVHAIVFDADGNGLYGPIEKGVMYPAAALIGAGTIDRHRVKCISAEYMVKFKTGYKPSASDFQDIASLCEKFEMKRPAGLL